MSRKQEIKQSSRILLSLALVLLVAVTAGVSYAVYSYTSIGSNANQMNTGTITLLYDGKEENREITISDNLPMTDEQGKRLTATSNVFDFTILGSIENKNVPYEITVRKKSDSDNLDDMIKVYLVEIDDKDEKEVSLTMNDKNVLKYSELKQTEVDVGDYVEKTIYQGTIPKNMDDYQKNFRLRMWIADDTNYNPVKDGDGNIRYSLDGKNFTVSLQVYSRAAVVDSGL